MLLPRFLGGVDRRKRLTKIVKETPRPPNVFEIDKLDNAYYPAFNGLLVELPAYQESMGISEPIDFIFDDQSEKVHLWNAWNMVKIKVDPTTRRLLGAEPQFKNDEDALPLQAGDLLAWWVRRWELEGCFDAPDEAYPVVPGRPICGIVASSARPITTGARGPAVARARTLSEFQAGFPDEASCEAFLFERRWPDGFVCPACGDGRAALLRSRAHTYECLGCGRQTSVTAGTVMHRSKLPLPVWFWAAHLMATHSNGMSALRAEQLGITYKTAWLLTQKLRRSMVDPQREPLEGVVEVDQAEIHSGPTTASSIR